MKKMAMIVLLVLAYAFEAMAEITVGIHEIPIQGINVISVGVSPNGKYIVGTVDYGAFTYIVEDNSYDVWGQGTFFAVTNAGKVTGDLIDPSTNASTAGYAPDLDSDFIFLPNVENWIPADPFLSSSYGMTPDGNIIVGMGWHPNYTTQACYWDENYEVHALPRLANNRSACAYGVTDDGMTIVGWQETDYYGRCPSIWENGEQTVFDGLDGEFYCVNSDGTMAGGNYGGRLAIWKQGVGMTVYGDEAYLPNFMGVTEDNMFAGKDGNGAVIWTEETGVVSFVDYLESLGAEIPGGFSFYQINSVTPDGKVFVGWGSTPNSANIGTWYVTIDDGSDVEEQIVEDSSILMNYPNPFNPSTTISLELLSNQNIELSVYNSNGEMISSLARGMYKKGTHDFSFSGLNLSSGIYYAKLSSGNQIITRKMMLLK
ncbi:MAG: T9SS type A sorting domain-containing protein [Candidatus Delongbacteria bacterium]|nr:T9SS type A sorting domain-containing protein [Candidatus Delongbacteria bacterium]MBN2835098.1 T9SS type A sorting domain-containing protein [Candidatus Delongbacteria bacterium]